MLALALLLGAAPARADRAHTLNIYAWSAYFPRGLIANFEAQQHVHVNYTLLDDPDKAETVLSIGNSNFDLVTMNASPQLAREIPKGFWKPLDWSRIPNARNADPKIMSLLAGADPGNQHAVPWMWGTTGLLYDKNKIAALMPGAPVDSLDMILNPRVAAKFAGCGIGLIDSWGDVLPMVARYLGQPRLSIEPRALAEVSAKLRAIKPYVKHISTAGYYQEMAEGELCLSIGYSGDAMLARNMVGESHGRASVSYAALREMVPFYIDSLVIPADAPNAALALAFIDFVMRPEISAQVTGQIGFASANAAALSLLPPAIRDNAIVYPPATVRNRLELQQRYTPEEIRQYSLLWLQFKSSF